jgi:3-deoxy-D-manno-octulosonate 8-phosphate phosphatase (KDO 8-P phosphatase)
VNGNQDVRAGGRGWPTPEAYRAIKLVLLDVDGVLTDGGIYLDPQGGETKRFDVRDGSGIAFLRHAGLEVAILSGRSSKATEVRAAEQGIPATRIWQGARRKRPAFTEVLKTCGVCKEEVAFMGDDIVDLPILEQCGVSACPGDARPEAIAGSHLVCSAPGGRGAVRQFCEHLLKQRGGDVWEKALRKYLGPDG